MSFLKKMLAAVLILAMTLSLVTAAFAAGSTSPVNPDEPKNPGWNDEERLDGNTQDHNNTKVTTKVTNSAATVLEIRRRAKDNICTLTTARDRDNNKRDITAIGDGKNGVLDNSAGASIKTLEISSKAKVTVKAKAFKNSRVNKLNVKSKQVQFNSNCFTGTQVKNPTINITKATKASDIAVQSNAFHGLNSKATIVVNKNMSKTEFNKLKKKLQAAGFKGTIKQG